MILVTAPVYAEPETGHESGMGSSERASYDQPTATNGGEPVSESDVSAAAAGPPEPGGPADPVVVALLRNRIRFAPEVVAQAVIELEHAGRLRVEAGAGTPGGAAAYVPPAGGDQGAAEAAGAPIGPGTPVAAGAPNGPRDPADARATASWETLVLRRLAARALPAVPTPLSLLTTVDGGDFWEWRLELEQRLLAAADRERLIVRRLAPRQTIAVVCLLTAVLAAAVGALVAVFFRPSPGFGAALATALFGFILFSTTLGRLANWRLSDAGRRTVQQADEALAAAGPGEQVREGAIRTAVIPLSKNHVWSSHGGSWRVVGLGSRFGDAKRLPRQVREALPERRVLACQVVKRWYVPGGRERDPAHCCAFDDGASSFTWSFTVPERVWAALAVGDVVLVDFSPRRHRLYEVRPLDGAEL